MQLWSGIDNLCYTGLLLTDTAALYIFKIGLRSKSYRQQQRQKGYYIVAFQIDREHVCGVILHVDPAVNNCDWNRWISRSTCSLKTRNKKRFWFRFRSYFFPFWIVCNAISPFIAMAYFNTRHTSSHMNDSEFIKIGVAADNRISNLFLLKEETR